MHETKSHCGPEAQRQRQQGWKFSPHLGGERLLSASLKERKIDHHFFLHPGLFWPSPKYPLLSSPVNLYKYLHTSRRVRGQLSAISLTVSIILIAEGLLLCFIRRRNRDPLFILALVERPRSELALLAWTARTFRADTHEHGGEKGTRVKRKRDFGACEKMLF